MMLSIVTLSFSLFWVVISTELSIQLELETTYARAQQMSDPPLLQISEIISSVVELAHDAAMKGQTRIDIDWHHLPQLNAWMADIRTNKQDDVSAINDKLRGGANEFLRQWRRTWPDIPVRMHTNLTVSICWFSDTSCDTNTFETSIQLGISNQTPC
jgi:hypothetical protein